MRILWVCGSTIVGGAERATIQVLGLLRERGHEIAILCRRGSELERADLPPGAVLRPRSLRGGAGVRLSIAVDAARRSLAPDAMLVSTPDAWLCSCLTKPPRAKAKLVLARHMVVPLPAGVRLLARARADAVVAVSRAVKDVVTRGGGPRADRVHVIYNPVRFAPRDSPPEREERRRARLALGLDPEARLVGFFGGISSAKGVDDAVRAVARAGERLGAVDLLLCGRPATVADERRFARTIRELGVSVRIHARGHIDHIERALTAVDAAIVATRRSLGEAFPSILLEAMACGTPAVAYATGGVPEAIGERGEAGWLAAPDDPDALGDALTRALENRDAARTKAMSAFARVRRLCDPVVVATRYEQVLGE